MRLKLYLSDFKAFRPLLIWTMFLRKAKWGAFSLALKDITPTENGLEETLTDLKENGYSNRRSNIPTKKLKRQGESTETDYEKDKRRNGEVPSNIVEIVLG